MGKGPHLKGENDWAEGFTFVEERRNKCVINLNRWTFSSGKDYGFDDGLGLIGILLLNAIPCEHAYKNKKTPVLSFDFAKKHTKKIQEIEKAYLSGKIQVDAKQMAKGVMTIVNHLLNESIVVMNGKVTRPKRTK